MQTSQRQKSSSKVARKKERGVLSRDFLCDPTVCGEKTSIFGWRESIATNLQLFWTGSIPSNGGSRILAPAPFHTASAGREGQRTAMVQERELDGAKNETRLRNPSHVRKTTRGKMTGSRVDALCLYHSTSLLCAVQNQMTK